MAWGFGNSGAASGGGFNRHDALLRVQAPAHSIVTITKGTYHKSDAGHENVADHTVYDYYFIIHQSQFDSVNPWTVTATLGTQTSSGTIIIDTADEYDVELSYNFYIVKNGIALVNIEVERYAGASSGNTATLTYADGVATLYLHYSSGNGANWRTNTKAAIDVTDYSTMVLKINSANKAYGRWGTFANIPTYGNNITPTAETMQTAISEPTIFTVDISNISGNQYMGYWVFVGSSMGTENILFTDWYLAH